MSAKQAARTAARRRHRPGLVRGLTPVLAPLMVAAALVVALRPHPIPAAQGQTAGRFGRLVHPDAAETEFSRATAALQRGDSATALALCDRGLSVNRPLIVTPQPGAPHETPGRHLLLFGDAARDRIGELARRGSGGQAEADEIRGWLTRLDALAARCLAPAAPTLDAPVLACQLDQSAAEARAEWTAARGADGEAREARARAHRLVRYRLDVLIPRANEARMAGVAGSCTQPRACRDHAACVARREESYARAAAEMLAAYRRERPRLLL